MKHKLTIGLDLSINSTGICINRENSEPIYYIIVPALTKKMKTINDLKHSRITHLEYVKSHKDIKHNIKAISKKICEILKDFERDIDYVVIEDVAMRANGNSIIDLTLLNGYIRCELDHMNIPYKSTVPTQWKKQLLGNGQAKKDLTIYHWGRLDIDACQQMMSHNCKCDDIADAYFLSQI